MQSYARYINLNDFLKDRMSVIKLVGQLTLFITI